ncbi:MAG TPA: hypothetical protein PLW48_00750, partial [Alphaproteobacteria bacterium]|nr:hypothetical protein [Alphaproteobacteria bacterium]
KNDVFLVLVIVLRVISEGSERISIKPPCSNLFSPKSEKTRGFQGLRPHRRLPDVAPQHETLAISP